MLQFFFNLSYSGPMDYSLIKALHIIFVITWFAGLFYIIRLFIYHVEANDKPEPARTILQDQFKIMEKRLWYGITVPSAILTFVFGGALISYFSPVSAHPWLLAKFGFLILLYLYHFSCGAIYKQLKNNVFKYTSNQLRIWNEVATILLFAIIFLVVLKNIISMSYGIFGLLVFSALLMAAIKIYKSLRKD